MGAFDDRSCSIDLETGKATDNVTGIVYETREHWLREINRQKRAAMQTLINNRDHASDLQNLPGRKPYRTSDIDLLIQPGLTDTEYRPGLIDGYNDRHTRR